MVDLAAKVPSETDKHGQDFKGEKIEITKNTRVSEILEEYGDIADVMGIFGVKPVAGYSFRKMITMAITVEWAARVHRVPLNEFLDTLNKAVASKQI